MEKVYCRVLKKLGFIQSLADPCLLIFRDKTGVVYFVIYVDDCIFIASTEGLMKQFKQDIGKAFSSKELGELCKYLGCFFNQNEKQPKLIILQNLLKLSLTQEECLQWKDKYFEGS